MENKQQFLCVHGHFYQPPRENPWMEAIEYQASAEPFHDWNERIHFQSYLPNAKARVLDGNGNVLNIVNNFEKISFNFGPTLLSWIEFEHPETYRLILEADRKSREAHGGHGNAIAQAFNHMILPLANRRDKVTQVRWGIEYFKAHFQRDPEAVWLAETACNEETLEVLVENNMKYLILSPEQAEAVGSLDPKDWKDVSQGQVDPKKAYRCFLQSDPPKFIDIFFYDGPISKSLGFDDILYDAQRFVDRIESALDKSRKEPQLIHMSTDGETYGHHKAFGDRVLAYVLDAEAPKRGFNITNYGEYLSLNPPKEAVRIKAGENGEGTAWSCAHGVKRWKENCGCRGDGPGSWTQEWRKPLREALDYLRDELARFYEGLGSHYLKDVWEVRDRFIRVILDRSEKNVTEFFKEHARFPLSRNDLILALKLLEMQRHAMLMYTSCGWFFTELSGIETVQVLQYGARAIQLARETAGSEWNVAAIEKEFLERLALAKSNIPEYSDGRNIYQKFVKPSVISFEKLAAHYALSNYFEDPGEDFVRGFKVTVLRNRAESRGTLTLHHRHIRMRSNITLEEAEFVYVLIRFGVFDFRCSVKPASEIEDIQKAEEKLFSVLNGASIVELAKAIDHVFGEKAYALKDLFIDQRRKIIAGLTRETLEKVGEAYEKIHDENLGIHEVYQTSNLPVPEEIQFAAQYGFNRQLSEGLQDLSRGDWSEEKIPALARRVESARKAQVKINLEALASFLTGELNRRTATLTEQPDPAIVEQCMRIIRVVDILGVQPDFSISQDHLFELLRSKDQAVVKRLGGFADLARAIKVNLSEFPELAGEPALPPAPRPALLG